MMSLGGSKDSSERAETLQTLDVPEVLEIPDPAPYDEDPVATADYLVTMLLRRPPAVLQAEFMGGQGRWLIRGPTQSEECVAMSESVGEFRSVLARFGHHYMNDQLYGGHIRRMLRQQGQNFLCEIFMSNQGSTGYWIRAHARAV